jgi:hypothetical protein
MLILVRSRRKQNIRFRWFRRAHRVLINHRKCSFSTAKGVEAEGMQPPKRFERAKRKLVLSHEPDVKKSLQ